MLHTTSVAIGGATILNSRIFFTRDHLHRIVLTYALILVAVTLAEGAWKDVRRALIIKHFCCCVLFNSKSLSTSCNNVIVYVTPVAAKQISELMLLMSEIVRGILPYAGCLVAPRTMLRGLCFQRAETN